MKRWFCLLAIFAGTMSYAQGVRFDSNAWTASASGPIGSAAPMFTVPYATVTVCTDSSCAYYASLYTNSALTIPLTQPFKADALGRYGFWVTTGTYWLKACSAANKCNSGYITVGAAGTGSGTVTSVGLSLPSLFTVTGSPVTGAGTLTGALATQSANLVFAGPSSGSSAAPTFRALTLADLPTLFTLTTTGTSGAATYSGGVLNIPNYATGGGGGGSGTVTSVALTVPSIFGLTGSPITSSGTLALSLNTQAAHQFFAGPGTGSAVAPTFRSIISTDLPVATTSSPGVVQPDGATVTVSGGVISAYNPLSGMTAGYLPLAGSANTITGSAPLDYGITNSCCFTFHQPVNIVITGGIGGGAGGTEGTAPTAAAGVDNLWADSTAHRWKINNNSGVSMLVPGMLTGTTGVISGTALTNACDTGTATVTGAAVGSPVTVSTTDGTDIGANFTLRASVTASGTVTVNVCNPTAVSATPPSKSYNVAVIQ